MSRIIKCEYCGVEFEAKRSDAKYCSKSCCKRAYYQKNLEKAKEYTIRWYANNKEKNKIWCAKWYANNKEKSKIQTTMWVKENSEKYKAIKRKACYKHLGYPEELLEIKELQYQIKKEIKNQLKGE